ncbi:hypothetical protein K440DRAFT_664900 [Wilcoxina mikolae CBS 423.85]|nr:hypothetical protein K440DRAFT_664900 [Wilcoxina mikolae CBS 423.85]
MDAPLLATRASLALSSLTSQLAHLESQQSALLTSLSLTSSTLSNLPNYNAIAPTLQMIPTYTAKLSRLRRAMVQQQQEVESLKRRALEAGKRRREHLKKLREREREEGEKDRGVLRARVVGEGSSQTLEEGAEGGVEEGRMTPVSVSSGRGTPVQGAVKVVKKRKKARKVEIQ